LAGALSVYRLEHGTYPEKLDDLVPGNLPRLPVDFYSEKPFLYHQLKSGYLLYSVGENGRDDGGSNEWMRIRKGRWLDDLSDIEQQIEKAKIPSGADDISIRVPRPAFEWPKAAAK
jgi:hypothetical protein